MNRLSASSVHENALPVGRMKAFWGLFLQPAATTQVAWGNLGWLPALGVSGTAFTLFFLQTGLDVARAGRADLEEVLIFTLLGLSYGTFGVVTLGTVAWLGIRVMGGSAGFALVVQAFAWSYAPTLLYAALGVLANVVLGWNSAVAFGVTGLLWALGPVSATIRYATQGKTMPAVILTTVCGLLMLWGWAILGDAI